jgi:uncharacterized protein involved in exopolysaccharide biosynthesis
MSLDQQSIFLNQMDQVIQSQSKDLNAQLEKINPEILQLQKQVQELTTEQDRLIRTRDVAKETYTTLARKVDETKISTADTNGSVQIASQAIVPDTPVSNHSVRNTAIGMMVGLLVGIFGVLIIAWWKEVPTGKLVSKSNL